MEEPDTPSRSAPAALDSVLSGGVDGWLAELRARTRDLGRLLDADIDQQERAGTRHTIREIAQQPVTWIETARRVTVRGDEMAATLAWLHGGSEGGTVLLTGSGSSLYAGECLAPALQDATGLAVRAVPAGELLIHLHTLVPVRGRCLVVSFGRSGNSPESCGAIDAVREAAPDCRHLVITCNAQGRLATRYRDDARVRAIVLDDATNDRSLVMTSSFTNMVLAARLLGAGGATASYVERARAAADAAAEILLRSSDALAAAGRASFESAVYLGSGARYGSAREAALKMLEMTNGRVKTLAESYLGLRHGPMCAVASDTLVVCFLASDPVTRAYEVDLIRELSRKELGARKVIVGHGVPAGLASAADVVVDVAGQAAVPDADAPLLDVVAGQLLAAFRCLSLGLRPDMPSDDGVISRVVEEFALHRRS